MEFINSFDSAALDFIRNHVQNGVLDKVFPIVTALDNGDAIWIVISLILLTQKKYRRAGAITLAALLITFLIGEIGLKNLVGRDRPFVTNEGLKLLINAPKGYSFPSGHAASSFTGAAMLSMYFKKYRWALFLLASLIAFSRVYLMVHYLSDVIGGALFGTIVAVLMYKLCNRKLQNIFT